MQKKHQPIKNGNIENLQKCLRIVFDLIGNRSRLRIYGLLLPWIDWFMEHYCDKRSVGKVSLRRFLRTTGTENISN